MRRQASGGVQLSSAELVNKKGTTKKLLAKRTKEFADGGVGGMPAFLTPTGNCPL